MKLEKYKPTDCAEIVELFYSTVHVVNAKDYTKTQLDAWATGNTDISTWDNAFLEHNTLVAKEKHTIVGFGDMDDNGYLDKLYVHKDYQGKGIATAIVKELEQHAAMHGISSFTTHASITAKPFFEKQGYRVVRKNCVVRNGVSLINFTMEKGNEK
ncbi:GNAT family N-acetyltransferase [Anaerotignum sp.]|uniref:GNAT family N-acetyltransferase n=1 Tax=Anaerotignum sp. TaxID=2039241 RepID=UPI0028A2D4E7|nr:GNAT family N-acetyltransferase [Anaerotignum sp.]